HQNDHGREMKPHKHAEVIKAWADGAKVQVRDPSEANPQWTDATYTPRWYNDIEYRVKPAPKQLWVRPFNRIDGGWTVPALARSDTKDQFFFLPLRSEWVGPAVLVWEEK